MSRSVNASASLPSSDTSLINALFWFIIFQLQCTTTFAVCCVCVCVCVLHSVLSYNQRDCGGARRCHPSDGYPFNDAFVIDSLGAIQIALVHCREVIGKWFAFATDKQHTASHPQTQWQCSVMMSSSSHTEPESMLLLIYELALAHVTPIRVQARDIVTCTSACACTIY